MVGIVYINAWKWENETWLSYSKSGGKGIKANEEGDEFN
jgi:hypothetical protein